jgi:hypothetical protein
MKTSKLTPLLQSTFTLTVGIIFMFIITSCTKKISFLTSSVVPAARGTIKVKTDSNNNQVISLEVFNLAEPERLTPPKKFYMVWMVTDQNVTKNLGQIKTSSGTFSKTLKASFETVTTFKPMKIFITAEDDSNVQSPGWEVVLMTNNF